jgi:mitogen-activated protein kinase organizer 1
LIEKTFLLLSIKHPFSCDYMEVIEQKSVMKGHIASVSSVVFNSKGEYCISGSYDKTIRLWNPFKEKCIKIYRGHGYQVVDVDVHTDNSQLASCGGDKTPFLWDVQSGSVLRKFKGHDSNINCITYGCLDNILVTGGYDKATKMWDCKSRSYDPIQTFLEARDSVSSVCVSQFEITTGSIDEHVRTYDIRRGQLRTDNIGFPVTSLRLTKDEKLLLVSSLDNTIRLFDRADGKLLVTYKGHKNSGYPITSLFDNCDSTVLSGSEDGYFYWWNCEDGTLLRSAKAHHSRACAIDYHPNEDYLLTASSDETIKLWHLKK